MSQMKFTLKDNKPNLGAPGFEKGQEPEKKKEPSVYTVSSLNRQIKGQLELNFSSIWLQGEISNFKAHSSGHFYFSLKDEKSQINALMFRGNNSKLKFKPEVGMEVIVRGKVNLYEPRGTYSFNCESMEPVGAGALQKAFDQLKTKLRKEGLFSDENKKPLPLLPKHVALVTAPTGAAVRDMLNVLQRRAKNVKVTVIPCLVQGEAAPQSIVASLSLANQLTDVDAIIVGRGGGSMEDLWGFNSELVARAIFSCQKPVISAVGHEVDFTIADFVADRRAPTPSAAAELVAGHAENLLEKISSLGAQLVRSIRGQLELAGSRVNTLDGRLVNPAKELTNLIIRCDDLDSRLQNAITNIIQQKKLQTKALSESLRSPEQILNEFKNEVHVNELKLNQVIKALLEKYDNQIQRYTASLNNLSPLKVVERGYSIVSKGSTDQGEVLTSVKQVKTKDSIFVRLAEGQFTAEVTGTFNESKKN